MKDRTQTMSDGNKQANRPPVDNNVIRITRGRIQSIILKKQNQLKDIGWGSIFLIFFAGMCAAFFLILVGLFILKMR